LSEEFQIDTEAVHSAVGNVGGLLMQTVTLALDLERLFVPPTSYAQIGSEVATGGAALKGQQVVAVQSLLKVLQDINVLVGKAADSAQADDAAIAASLRGAEGSVPGSGQGGGLLSNLWSSPSAGQLAGQAMAASAHASAASTGHSVSTVLDYMRQVGMGDLSSHTVGVQHTGDPAAFANWLDTDPDNQTQVGVIGIYSGNSGTMSDVPGGVHPGDVVYASRWQIGGGSSLLPQNENTIGVVGNDGQLYNNGQINTDNWYGVTDLRVYRPLSNSL
jgi:hypothetical protein